MAKKYAPEHLLNLPIGTKIIIKNSYNGALAGVPLTITMKGSEAYTVKTETGVCYTVYFAGSPVDDFEVLSRKAQADCLKVKLENLEKEIAPLKAEIERLEKFESDEAEVADKLHRILKASDSPKAIEAILKELKSTHLL